MSENSERREQLTGVLAKVEKKDIYGFYLAPEKLEEITGIPQEDRKYGLGVMACRKIMEDVIQALHGIHPMVRQEDGGLRILPPEEAAEHGLAMFERARDKMSFWHLKSEVAVPVAELTPETQKRYLERRAANARRLLAMQSVDLDE